MSVRPWKRVTTALVGAFTVAVSLAACGGESGGSATAVGGTLTIARPADQITLDPAQVVEVPDIAVTNQLFERLFVLSPDGSSVIPSLATDSTMSEDGRELTVTLREGAKFSDGSDLDSADVVYSLDRSRKADAGFSFLLAEIESVEAPDPSTVVIRTANPTATLEASLSAWVASIVPADLGGQSPEEFFETPVGSGPFTMTKWARGTSIEVARNTTYSGADKPKVESVRWTVVPDANTRTAQVQGGTADIATDIAGSQVETLDNGRTSAESFPGFFTSFLIFNEDVEPFADVKVRRAIAYAIDKSALTKATLREAGEPACSMVPPTMLYAQDDSSCLEHDLDKAKAELAASSAPNGFSVAITIDNLPTSSPVAQIVQDQLAKIGIKLTIKTVDAGQLYTVLGDQAYEMGLAAWISDIPDPDEQLSFMLDPAAGGNAYYTGYDNPTMNDLIASGRSTLDPDARAKIYAQVQDLAAQDVPHVPLSHQGNAFVWGPTVEGVQADPLSQLVLDGITKVKG
jgi:peptide/nickel transport system substrate-binding protein